MLIFVSLLLLGSFLINLYFIKRFRLFQKLKRKVTHAVEHVDVPNTAETVSFTDRPLMLHCHLLTMNEVPECSDVAGSALPDQLVIGPGCYNIDSRCYKMEQEGLLRYLNAPKRNEQRIVYQGDVTSLLSAICWISSHGQRFDSLSNQELTAQAMKGKVLITCGRLAKWALEILQSQNVKSRLVASLTTHQWNRMDDGHTMIEVFDSKLEKWVLYDLDKDSYFVNRTSKSPLSLIEFCRAQEEQDYEIVKISAAFEMDPSGYIQYRGFDYSLIFEYIKFMPRIWYRKVMQVPVIFDPEVKKFYFFERHMRGRLETHSLDFEYVDEAKFLKKFYSQG